jgi:hypothetical protein
MTQNQKASQRKEDEQKFDCMVSIALSDLLACCECDDAAAVLVVGHDTTTVSTLPLCLACYSSSPFSEEPVHRELLPQ